jgi:hypothetical protein
VVVVSEETSKISIACDGILDRDIIQAEFRDRLMTYLKK